LVCKPFFVLSQIDQVALAFILSETLLLSINATIHLGINPKISVLDN
jgi:hypothetical protein